MGAVIADSTTETGRVIVAAAACLHDAGTAAADRAPLLTAREALRAALDSRPLRRSDAIAGLRLLAELDAELAVRDELVADRRLEVLVRIHESLGRLRACTSVEELIEAAPRELCIACGFSRAMISRVHGSVWVPEVLHIEGGYDLSGRAEFARYVDAAEIPLEHLLLETELVRRRIPALVLDPERRTHPDIAAASRSTSYVAAPIMPTKRVIGFFHADHFDQDREADADDRDDVWAFAQQFGLIYERAVLFERLEDQRQQLREALSDAADQIDELCEADLDLTRREAIAPDRAAASGMTRTPASRLEALLTAREREVLELMASGATNTLIAEQLVVSEGTIKTHVKRILRKLHVSNRAEAVARYMNVVLRERSPEP